MANKGNQVLVKDLSALKIDKYLNEKVTHSLFSRYFPADSVDATNRCKPVTIKALEFRYNWTPGSVESIKFHTGLRGPNTGPESEIYGCEAVRQILIYKWHRLWYIKLIWSLVQITYVALLMNFEFSYLVMIPFAAI